MAPRPRPRPSPRLPPHLDADTIAASVGSHIDESILLELRNSISGLLGADSQHNDLHLDQRTKLFLQQFLLAINLLIDPVGTPTPTGNDTPPDASEGLAILHHLLVQRIITIEINQSPSGSQEHAQGRISNIWSTFFRSSGLSHNANKEPAIKVLKINTSKLVMNKERLIRSLDNESLQAGKDANLARVGWLFRQPKKMPYIKSPGLIFLYPFADVYIREPHRARFQEVADILAQAVSRNSSFSDSREWVQRIAYNLAMCGTCMSDAEPSIVVYCPGKDPRKIKQLVNTFSQNHIQDQYAHRRCKISYRLFIWAEELRNTGGTMDALDIDFNNGSSLCGSPIRALSGARLSTVACILQAGPDFFALTSAHALETGRELESEIHDITDDDLSPSSLSGVTYDLSGFSTASHDHGRNTMLGDQNYHSEYMKKMRCSTASRAPIDQANLDWALLKIEEPTNLQPNAYQVTGGAGAGRSCITSYIKQQPSFRPINGRSVRIILSHNEICRGSISPIPIYLSNSSDSTKLCEAWAVVPTDGRALHLGDSGSLVVDVETNMPYGHVISMTPVGTICVMPLVYTLPQIRVALGSQEVQLLPCVWYEKSRTETDNSNTGSSRLSWLSTVYIWFHNGYRRLYGADEPSGPVNLSSPIASGPPVSAEQNEDEELQGLRTQPLRDQPQPLVSTHSRKT